MPVPDPPAKAKSETAKSRSFFVARARSGLARSHIRSAFCLGTLTEDAPDQPVPRHPSARYPCPARKKKKKQRYAL